MKPSSGLRRDPNKPLKRSKPMPRVSKKYAAVTYKYRHWSQNVRREVGRCQIGWEGLCTGQPDGIHHVIKKSAGGALKPGPLADEQGQEFLVSCNPCNTAVEDYPAKARELGLSKPNPLRRKDW